ncbi:MAG: STAS/SEC14 domain-containing protein [Microcoleus sp. SIO2G3]|nr:STAS/SEC14 domain-containing protein [Microcoleus sp. SIO2G3]
MNIPLVESIVQVISTLSPEEQALVRQKLAIVSLPPSEAELISQIRQALLPDIEERYRELREKLQAEMLSVAEHQELLALTDTIEQADANRLQRLITLAQMRQVSLPDLMDQLGLQQQPVFA